MKLTRYSIAPAIVLGLCVGLAGACGPKKPPGTNPPGESGGSGDGGGGDAGSDGGGGSVSDGGDGGAASEGGGDGGGGGAPTTCDAKVADTPTLLFSGQVIIRPPVGVEFVEDDNPMVQQAIMSGGFMSACDALIKRMLVVVYEKDKKRKPTKLVEEFMKSSLEPQGYTGGTKSSAYVDTATDYHLSVEYGGGGGGAAAVLYLAVARRADKDFVVVLETTPEEFKLLKPTFQESAMSLFPVPQE
ncbi:MAG: hypothetical protein AAGF11_29095 [Myxococcota bacterium]